VGVSRRDMLYLYAESAYQPSTPIGYNTTTNVVQQKVAFEVKVAQEAQTQQEVLVRLRQNLAKHFSEEEIRTLCFDMGVDYENLPAIGKENKAREFIVYLERCGRLPELVENCRELRPSSSWPTISGPIQPAQTAYTAPEVQKTSDNEIHHRVGAKPKDWTRRIAVGSIVLVIVIATVVYAVLRLEQQMIDSQAQRLMQDFQEASNYQGVTRAERAKIQRASLAGLFRLKGYADRARWQFFEQLPLDQQRALFEPDDPKSVQDQLVAVIEGTYTELWNDERGNELLQAMIPSLRKLDRADAINLATEIEQWLQGRTSQNRGDCPQAMQAYKVAISLNTGNSGTHFDYALALVCINDPDQALVELETVLSLNWGGFWQARVRQEVVSDKPLYAMWWQEKEKYKAIAALVPAPTPATSAPTPTPTESSSIASRADLVNGDFEAPPPWPLQDNIREVQVAPSWRAWYLDKPPAYVKKPVNCGGVDYGCYWMRPEFRDMVAASFPNRVHSGFYAQEYFSYGRMHEAGLYQQIGGIKPETMLRFSIWIQAWQCFNIDECGKDGIHSDKPAEMHLKVGIDPNGGSDPLSSNIVWSSEQEAFDRWVDFSVEAKAAGDTVTVFTHSRADWDWARTYSGVYLDDASLAAVP